jgi:hypothetical protein
MSIEGADDLIKEIQKRDLSAILIKRGVDIAVLVEVLRVSAADPETEQAIGSFKSAVDAVDTLSLQLLGAIEKDKVTKNSAPHVSSRTGHLIPELPISRITLALVELCNEMSGSLPDGLISLLQVQLNPRMANENQRPSMSHKRAQAIVAEVREPGISTRKLAQKAGVNQSTVSRWRMDPSHQASLRQIRRGGKKRAN